MLSRLCLIICLLFSVTAFSDTPPPIDITKMKAPASTPTGLVQAINQTVSIFAPCPTVGYILKSNGAAWICGPDAGGAVDSVNGQTGTVVITANQLLPSQVGQGGKFLQTDGTNTSWQTASGTGAVDSVNGQTGAVSLDTDDIPEGASNKYFSNSLARASVSADPPLSYNVTTGAFSIPLATSSIDGYLSATDRASFAAKEPAISAGTSAQYWRGDKTFQTLDTGAVPENGNLYYTASRFNSAFASKTTSDLSEGTNLYYTQGRFDTAFSAKTTDNLTEGATNKYFNQSLARASVSATAPITYNSGTGVFAMPAATDSQDGYLTAADHLLFSTASSGGITQLTGDVTAGPGSGSQAATVALVGGKTAAAVSTSVDDTQAATAANTPNTIVKRDGSGNFAAGTINASVLGTASNITGVVAITNGGTGQSNQQAGLNNITDATSHSNGDVLQLLGGNAQFAPLVATTGTPTSMTWYDQATGVLDDLPGWSVAYPSIGLYGNNTWTAPVDGGGTQYPRSISSFIQVATPQDTTEFIPELAQLEMQVDSNNDGFNLQSAYGLLLLKSHGGDGTINYQSNLDVSDSFGNGTNTGTTNDANTLNVYGTVAANYTIANSWYLINGNMNIAGTMNAGGLQNLYMGGAGSITNNFTAQNIGMQVPVAGSLNLVTLNNNQTVGDNYSGLFISSDSAITNNSTVIGSNNTNTVGGNLNMFNTYNSTTGAVGGDFRMGQFGNDGTVANNSAGILTTQNGKVEKSHTGFGSQVGADIGDGTGNNLIHFDAQSFITPTPKTVDGNIFGFNYNNNAEVIGNNNNTVLNANNQGEGYRFTGAAIYNQADQSEEIVGYRFSSQGNMRTGTGADIFMQGVATDDARGLKVNVNQLTSPSTSNHVRSAEFEGGTFSINSNVVPFDNGGVDIGNYYGMSTEIPNGAPILGTDVIQQIFQSNLILHDTITGGPFGLGVNGVGIVNQLAFDSGITHDNYRAVLMGATNPQGAGTLNNFTALTILALPSFGGALTVVNKTAIEDGNLVGQPMCTGATGDCWFIKNNDYTAQSALGKLAINTANQKVSTNVRLEVHDGHIKSTQATAPVASVQAAAGVGGTCSVSGNDVDGKVSIQAGTSTANGSQCVITFNVAYNSAPKCTWSPSSPDAGKNLVQTYFDKTTTDMTVQFNAPDLVLGLYEYDYHCVETN